MSADVVDPVADIDLIAETVLRGEDAFTIPDHLVAEPTPPAVTKNLYNEIMAMPMGPKLKLALRGNRDARAILIHDSSPVVQRFVMRNPRLTEDEALQFAKNRNLDSEVLVIISKRKDFVRNYPVRVALVSNPKTPLAIALRLVTTLVERDVRLLAKNRNIPSAVNRSARRMISDGKFRR